MRITSLGNIVFNTNELVANIVGSLFDESDERANKRSIAWLASLNATTHHEVSRLVWRELPSLFPLLWTLPSNAITYSESCHECRVVCEESVDTLRYPGIWTMGTKFGWDAMSRWTHYSPYVRRLRSYNQCHVDTRLINHIVDLQPRRRPKNHPLLPNLQALEFLAEKFNDLDAMLQFVVPGLQKLDIVMPTMTMRKATATETTDQHNSTDLDTLTRLICEREFHEFNCNIPLPPPALTRLAMMPNLRAVELAFPCSSEAITCFPPESSFRSLTDLHISLTKLDDNSLFLFKSIRSPDLRRLSMAIQTAPSSTTLLNHLDAISRIPSRSALHKFSLYIDRFRGQSNTLGIQPGASECLIDAKTLRSLFQMSQLEDVRITSDHLSLDDEFIKEMANAFPGLRNLALCPSTFRPSSSHSRITLSGLRPLAQNCLRLESIDTFFDNNIPLGHFFEHCDYRHIPVIHPKSKVTHLDVGDLIARSPTKMAAAIHCLFPNLNPDSLMGWYVPDDSMHISTNNPANIQNLQWDLTKWGIKFLQIPSRLAKWDYSSLLVN